MCVCVCVSPPGRGSAEACEYIMRTPEPASRARAGHSMP